MIELFLTLIITTADPTAADLLEKARSLYETQEYDAVVPVAREVIALSDATGDQRLDARLLEGSCLAILGKITEAEVAFRRLLRGRPDFTMSDDTSPKILAVFRRVEGEERAIREEVKRLERERAIAEMAIHGDPGTTAKGAAPIPFEFRIRDPRGLVTKVEVHYRRAGGGLYSSLPLLRNEATYAGSVLAEWTANDEGFVMEWYVVASDRDGARLVGVGDESAPRQITVAAGQLEVPSAFYETGWFWGIAAGVTLVAGGVTYAIVRQSTAYPDSDLGEVRLP